MAETVTDHPINIARQRFKLRVWITSRLWAQVMLGMVLGFALAVLPAIILSGVPDRSADHDAGKRTLVVRLGIATSVRLAMVLLALSALGALVLALGPVPVGVVLPLIALPHAALLIWLLRRYLSEGAAERRIDLLLGLGLLYIAWFVVVPFVAMI